MAVSGSLIRPNQSPLPFLKPSRPNLCCKKYVTSAGNGEDDEGCKMSIRKENESWKIDFSGNKPATPLLDTINYPLHMKNLSTGELEQLAAEIRADIVHSVSKTGGHLSSSLGVVELTIALHHVFDTPEDKIIWDVGHQDLQGFLKGMRVFMMPLVLDIVLPAYQLDLFLAVNVGMAVARDLLKKNNNVISVIGDGAMTAGLAYEAMNNAGFLDSNLIVVLNDNKQVSLPTATLHGPATPVGGLSRALTKIQASAEFRKLRETAKVNFSKLSCYLSSLPGYTWLKSDCGYYLLLKGITKQIGGPAHEIAAKVDEYARGMISAYGSTLFEELGLYYIGPVDGHNIEDLVAMFKKVKAMPAPGPVLIHIVTEKGKGYPPAEAATDKMHGVVRFDTETGKQFKSKSSTLSYTQYFAESLIKEAETDDKIVAIHAAMGGGTGLNYFQKAFPDRCFDVGIAEQHAITFAAGLAAEGLKPFCAIYSSFLQRGYDQVVHDVDLQKLPVRFAMDRAGLVGADGPTHCGAFDITYMACLPNMVVMAPSDEAELMHMVATAAAIDDRPSCFRFPRGNGTGVVIPHDYKGTPLEIGRGRIIMEGNRVAILGYGLIVQQCIEAANMLRSQNIYITVADARFCKPLDSDLIKQLAREHEILITVEEGSIGGFGSHVSHFLSLNGILDGSLKLRAMVLPDRYIDHGSPQDQIEEAGLSSRHISATVLSMLGRPREALQFKHE
ncbi:hypothetical protein GQ457_02G008900 [Hibiscus cannabinus]